ncbi:MAG: cupin domain-containing protein [Chloroflexi bacterium]|nr:cupin domain-containing protein [Chloroflexota bacterium]
MERELERLREREPKMHDYTWNENMYLRWEEQRKQYAARPRILKYSSVPWEQVWMAYHKVFAAAPEWTTRKKNFSPIRTMTVLEQIITPGGRSGKHRHFPEALFFVLEGKGWEIHDDKKWPWEAGDAMCVPTYCIHQHFADPSTGARLFYIVPAQFELMGMAQIEQLEVHQGFQLPKGTEQITGSRGQALGYKRPDGVEIHLAMDEAELTAAMASKQNAAKLTGAPANTYDKYIARLAEEAEWRRDCPHVVHGAQRPWEETRMGRLKYLIYPGIPSGIVTLDAWIQIIPPGGRSGKHRHAAEEVHKIMEGRGYDVIDGQRHDWEKEDVACMPILSTHQHFNASSTEPAMFYSVQPRLYDFIGHGGYEHFEDAYAP